VRAWRDTAFAAAGTALVLPALAGPLLLLAALLAAKKAPAVLLVLLGAAFLLPAWAAALTAAQRSRFWALLGVDIPRLAGVWEQVRPRQVTIALRSPLTWRQAAYHVLVTPVAAVGGVVTLAAWGGGAGLFAVFAWAKVLPVSIQLQVGKPERIVLCLAGLLLVLAAPWLAAAVVRLDSRAALALLGPSRAEELARRVETLAESRAGVVDAADAERRRIERDLHDGAQRRLVSLAMNLGMARAELPGLPEHAQKIIIEAHEEAKLALAELRDLVRGLHPAILEDRGLDAALSGIAARSPVPVRLRVDVPVRAAPTIEAVAYFVVSEALTNIAKHSGAGQAEIAVHRRAGLLRVAVTDDGVGGADPARGSGLAGLARRAASVDGTLRIASPGGGPTVITVELPCGS
jgi:signal transduction histidine kinase